MLVVAPVDHEVSQKLTKELALIGGRFAAELKSDLPCVNLLVEHVERYRGKMLRPMLVLVSAMASSSQLLRPDRQINDGHRIVSTVAEMVHMATLVHDDILDEAAVRRRGQTVNQLQGNETAVMLGDYLISHAYHLCSSLPTSVASRIIAAATNTVCEGELLQLANRQNWELDEATYYEIIRRKTASLTGACCRLGAVLHNLDENISDALYEYGEKVGQAFQIIDDVLDLTGDEETVGKSLGRDVEKGKLTLPMIHALQHATAADRASLLAMLKQGSITPQQTATIQHILTKAGSLEASHNAATKLIDHAKAALCILPDSPARHCLLTMADAVITRKF